jgi:hypothetical protein
MLCPFLAVPVGQAEPQECKREICAVFDIESDCCSLLSVARHLSSMDRKSLGD